MCNFSHLRLYTGSRRAECLPCVEWDRWWRRGVWDKQCCKRLGRAQGDRIHWGRESDERAPCGEESVCRPRTRKLKWCPDQNWRNKRKKANWYLLTRKKKKLGRTWIFRTFSLSSLGISYSLAFRAKSQCSTRRFQSSGQGFGFDPLTQTCGGDHTNDLGWWNHL